MTFENSEKKKELETAKAKVADLEDQLMKCKRENKKLLTQNEYKMYTANEALKD